MTEFFSDKLKHEPAADQRHDAATLGALHTAVNLEVFGPPVIVQNSGGPFQAIKKAAPETPDPYAAVLAHMINAENAESEKIEYQAGTILHMPADICDKLGKAEERHALNLPLGATDEQVVKALDKAPTAQIYPALGALGVCSRNDRQLLGADEFIAPRNSKFSLMRHAYNEKEMDKQINELLALTKENNLALRKSLQLPSTATDKQVDAALTKENNLALRKSLQPPTATDEQVNQAMLLPDGSSIDADLSYEETRHRNADGSEIDFMKFGGGDFHSSVTNADGSQSEERQRNTQ